MVIESACRLCGYATEVGVVVHPAVRFSSVPQVLAALAGWARTEGEDDLARFCDASFNGLTAEEVAARILRGEAVETGFDVIAYLFPQTAFAGQATPRALTEALRGGLASAPSRSTAPEAERPPAAVGSLPAGTIVPWEELPEVSGRAAERPSLPPPPPAEPAVDAADTCRALWAVALADGRKDPREEAVVAAECAALGVPVVPRDGARVWRPGELARPTDPARVLGAMERVARADGGLDRSEIRVLREYARAWGVAVPDARWRPPRVWEEAVAGLFGR